MILLLCSVAFFGCLGIAFFIVRPKSRIHSIEYSSTSKKQKLFFSAVCVITILICVLPMNLSPIWNGEIPAHRNQYEEMANSILEGHLYLDDEVDSKLLEMENPYDTDERNRLGAKFEWDHAFYNGKYYMYFGVVPVFLVFLPYRIITGNNLTTYHGTQLFTAFFIIGVFALFWLLSKKLYKNISCLVLFICSAAFSIISVWYFSSAPALYCTANSAGVCMEIWSLYFLFKAVYDSEKDGKAILYATLGTLFGALCFGCRPPIAIANLVVIPLIYTMLKDRHFNKKFVLKSAVVVVPYIVIGVLLMVYNYVRFDSPFEFGQSYQLTVTDQSNYGNILSRLSIGEIIKSFKYYFLELRLDLNFVELGIFIMFPVFLVTTISVLNKNSITKLKSDKLVSFVLTGIFSIVFIVIFQAVCSPYPVSRYRTDIYWLMCVVSFIFVGTKFQTAKNKRLYGFVVASFCILAMVTSAILFLTPNDGNFSRMYYPDSLTTIKKILTFGLIK